MKKYTAHAHAQTVIFYKLDAYNFFLEDDERVPKVFVLPKHSKLRRELDDYISQWAWDAVDSDDLIEVTESDERIVLARASDI